MIRTALVAILLAASPVYAQEVRLTLDKPTTATTPASPTLSSIVEADLLRDLPLSDNLYQLLETTQPSVISDRFSGGGLFAGQAARVGGFFGSSSQTLFRLDGVSITDPTGSGASLAFPDLSLWRRIDVTTGMMPLTANALGLAVTLDPIAPTERWVRTLAGSSSRGPLASQAPATAAPAVARLGSWDRLSASATGPLVNGRLGGAFATSWNRSTQFTRSEPDVAGAEHGSAFARLVFTPSARHEVRAIGWLQRSTFPSNLGRPFGQSEAATIDQSGHVQLLWERHPENAARLQVSGSYTQRGRAPDGTASPRIVFERLTDGPLDAVSAVGGSTVRQWSVGVNALSPAATSRVHALEAGVELSGARASHAPPSLGPVGELVNGIPARVWVFNHPGRSSLRRETMVVAHANDHVRLSSKLTFDAGLAFDAVSGSARGGADGITWQTLLPRVSLGWSVTHRWTTSVFAAYRRSAYRLPLDVLAVGDPAALAADVFRWDAPSGTSPSLALVGPLVARVGPGTGGNAAFSAIEDNLKRPYLDELVIGLASHPARDLTVRFVGVKRRERNVLGVVNTGVPLSSYTTFGVPDVGANVFSAADDGIVTVYDRLPASFGLDSYRLTNPAQDDSTSESVELSVQVSREHLFLFVGGTASRTDGAGANRGYGPVENDEGILGEVFSTPNAGTYARGRLFNDRAYTGKVVGVFVLPKDMRLGLLVRYQDGQPFGRLIVMPGLNQGAEAVRAYANGGSRFMFVGTLDARLQKTVSVGRFRVAVVLDAYNLPNMTNETEEDVVSGPAFRTITAVQPPRTFQLGLRVTF